MTADERKALAIIINILMALVIQAGANESMHKDLMQAAELLGLSYHDLTDALNL